MKRQAVLIAVVSILLASCGGSGWSCKKSYCDIQKERMDLIKTDTIAQQKQVLVKP